MQFLCEPAQAIVLSYIPIGGDGDEDIKKLNPSYLYGKVRQDVTKAAIELSATQRLQEMPLYDFVTYAQAYPDTDAEKYLRDHKFSIIYSETQFAKDNPTLTAKDFLARHIFTALNSYNEYKKEHPHTSAERYLIDYDFEQRLETLTPDEIHEIMILAEDSAPISFQKIAVNISYVAREILAELDFLFAASIVVCSGTILIASFLATFVGVILLEESKNFISIRRIFDKNIELAITAVGRCFFKNFDYEVVVNVAGLCYLALQLPLILAFCAEMEEENEGYSLLFNAARIASFSFLVLSKMPLVCVEFYEEIFFSAVKCNWLEASVNALSQSFDEFFDSNMDTIKQFSEKQLLNIQNYQKNYRLENAKELWATRIMKPLTLT